MFLVSLCHVAGDRSKKTKVDEKKEVDESVKVPVALLRFQSGPRAEILSPGGRDRGFLQLQVNFQLKSFSLLQIIVLH